MPGRTSEVRAGQYRASTDSREILITSSLGSCVAVALYDPASRVAGLGHILIDRAPSPGGDEHPGWYADTGIPALLREMTALKACPTRMRAHIAGGADMFPSISGAVIPVGMRNIQAVRAALLGLGIPILAEDVGGFCARKLRLEVATGKSTAWAYGPGRGGDLCKCPPG